MDEVDRALDRLREAVRLQPDMLRGEPHDTNRVAAAAQIEHFDRIRKDTVERWDFCSR